MENSETLKLYNDTMFNELWKQHADGTISSWSMSALCFYDEEHELQNINEEKYGIVNFNNLPEQPVPYDYYTRYVNGVPKHMPKYNITRIAGTVLNADNNHHMVTLLTKYGPVNVKMNKGHYAFYSKRISTKLDPNSDTKTVLEDSWLKRGNMIVIAGIRREDTFWPLIYKDTIYKHTVNLIKEVYEDGTLLLQTERTKI
jgi:DNA polymerase-3 subunit alpha